MNISFIDDIITKKRRLICLEKILGLCIGLNNFIVIQVIQTIKFGEIIRNIENFLVLLIKNMFIILQLKKDYELSKM